jgi:hypothetical protein
MRVSEVTISDLKGYANVYHNEDDNLFTAILVAAKRFIANYTGLPLTDEVNDCVDNHEDFSIALFVLSNEMYDNRTFMVENVKLNFVIKTILDGHSVNLL